jgi:hypothetical protein
MLGYDTLKKHDVIHIYSQPVEFSCVGVIEYVDKKKTEIYITTIKRDGEDASIGDIKIRSFSVNLKNAPSITRLSEEQQKTFLTTHEQKRIKEVQESLKEEQEMIQWS